MYMVLSSKKIHMMSQLIYMHILGSGMGKTKQKQVLINKSQIISERNINHLTVHVTIKDIKENQAIKMFSVQVIQNYALKKQEFSQITTQMIVIMMFALFKVLSNQLYLKKKQFMQQVHQHSQLNKLILVLNLQ